MTLPPMMLASPTRFQAVDARVALPDDLAELGGGATLPVVATGDDGSEYDGSVDVAFVDGGLAVSNIVLRPEAWRDGAAAAVIGVLEGEAWARLALRVRVDLRNVGPADVERHVRLLARWGYRQSIEGVVEREFAPVTSSS